MTDILKNFNLCELFAKSADVIIPGILVSPRIFFRVENNIVLKAQLNIKNYQELI